MHHYESSTELTSIEFGTSRQPMSRFCSWATGWTWWGPGRARTWRITSMLWRLGPIHKRHIGARRHSGYWRIYGLLCVYLEYSCLKVCYGKTGAMDAERWRQRVLQLIYLSLSRHNRIGSQFCMHSCSRSSGALDPRVDPIDQESISLDWMPEKQIQLPLTAIHWAQLCFFHAVYWFPHASGHLIRFSSLFVLLPD